MSCITKTTVIPLAGNCYITQPCSEEEPGACVSSVSGLGNWTGIGAVASVYFKIEHPMTAVVSIRAKCVGGKSRLVVTSGDTGKGYKVKISGDEFHVVKIGDFEFNKSGYNRIDIQGVKKSGHWIGDVTDLILEHEDCDALCYVCEPSKYHWGLRGPSINIFYQGYPRDADFYYNELTVPEGLDPVGAYFMAIGFDSGYFGIQTNSATRRTILFAVWSRFNTDDPTHIPSQFKVKVMRKGKDVLLEPFGGEGSGMHSNFDFKWRSGVTYKFLVHGSPIDDHRTRYAAWFWAPELESWQLLASFKQPKFSGYLNRFYSFDEGIDPTTSFIERKVLLGNQFVRTPDGIWTEVTTASFLGADKETGDRTDRTCGEENGSFFLRSCGFFDETHGPTKISRPAQGKVPEIPIELLMEQAFPPQR